MIVKSASTHVFSIDSFIEKFSEEIRTFHNSHDPIDKDHHLRFRFYLATYYFQNERYEEGIKNTLRCLALTLILNNQTFFMQCVALFEAQRHHATEPQKLEYRKIMQEIRMFERVDVTEVKETH
ncbi:hypothetical protein EEL32_07850 [Brevibacillus laterosporus]|uniref:Uncharacterized protein n=1 Tax=Brevibacillus laterosporus TaxID=1465 RepID=A0A502IPM3_BRELA|nr:hypothetical protein EEL30_19070 [Brevibacillus laterosporus]TPG68140.1 hypothetical protein EEL31_06030 [Brevibacillus laterosporus]TPG88847.1 hypothetical protein EEL32_07850 [Brevibacillus laterosporus]